MIATAFDLPVIAAGGIMNGADIAAALSHGASAAQLGTAFIGCPESSADAAHRASLASPGAANTIMTKVISGRPARCLPNSFTRLGETNLRNLQPPDYPLTYDAGKALNAAAKSCGAKSGGAKSCGDSSYGAQWAGQGAPRARAMPAAALIDLLRRELEASK
jgi:nitronate monooxygenase